MFKGFREFILRGNVVDMAVGVVIGAAFGGIVTAFVKDLLTPLIAAIVGKPDFSAYVFEIHGSKFLYGDFLNALISFLLIAAAVYYFVVLPVNAVMARFTRSLPPRLPRKPVPSARARFRWPRASVPSALRQCLDRLSRARVCS